MCAHTRLSMNMCMVFVWVFVWVFACGYTYMWPEVNIRCLFLSQSHYCLGKTVAESGAHHIS